MAFQELLRVRSVKHVEQKASDGGVSHGGFPGCVDCRKRAERVCDPLYRAKKINFLTRSLHDVQHTLFDTI